MDIERVTVGYHYEENGKRLRTQLEMKRLAFSHFEQLVDRWDTECSSMMMRSRAASTAISEIYIGYDRAGAAGNSSLWSRQPHADYGGTSLGTEEMMNLPRGL